MSAVARWTGLKCRMQAPAPPLDFIRLVASYLLAIGVWSRHENHLSIGKMRTLERVGSTVINAPASNSTVN